jgi:hypothetical protein
MNDGRWHISLMTSRRDLFSAILANKAAFALYDQGYGTEHDARVAERQIRVFINSAA